MSPIPAMFQKQQADPGLDLENRHLALQREGQQMQVAEGVPDEILIQQNQERQDLLRWQQELTDELEQLKRDLRSEYKDGDGKWVKTMMIVNGKEVAAPQLVNDTGIRMIEIGCRPLMSRNMINSNLDEHFVFQLLRRTMDTIVNNIAFYGEGQYDMEFANYSVVTRLIKNVIIPAPFRAVDGWNKKVDSTISKRVESFAESGQRPIEQKKKFLGMFS